MTSKDIRKQVKIEKKNYNVIYRSLITGNLGTYEALYKDEQMDGLTPSKVEPLVLSLRTGKSLRLIVDEAGLYKERCPYCFYLRITEYANKRETWELGNNYPVLSSKVDFGGKRIPRRRETSKYCDGCDTTFVKEKVVVAKY